MTENVHVRFEVHIEKKLKTVTINKSEPFCLMYFGHRRKKFCWLGAYSNTKVFIRNVSLRFYAKSKFCVCFEVHIPVSIQK